MSAEVACVSRETESVPRETEGRPLGALLQTSLADVSRETGPVLVSTGMYAVYATPARGLHLTWRPAGAESETHVEIPPGIVALIHSAMSGKQPNVKDIMRAMKGMRG